MGPDMEVIAIHDINDAYCKLRFHYVIDRSMRAIKSNRLASIHQANLKKRVL